MSENNTLSNQTNYEKVLDFMKAFGQNLYSTPQPHLIESNPGLTKLRLDLIQEEVKELSDAIQQNNFVEVVDALADILYVVYGAGGAFGVDLDEAFDIVHKSNMTKLCKTEQEAKLTIEWYKENEQRYKDPAYRLSGDEKYWIVYDKATGKVLKSINYTPANLTKFS